VYGQAQQVVGVDFPPAAEPGHAAEHGDALHLVLVVQQFKDFLHQVVTFELVTFLDVDARDGDCFQAKTPGLRDRYAPRIAAAIDSTTEPPTYSPALTISPFSMRLSVSSEKVENVV